MEIKCYKSLHWNGYSDDKPQGRLVTDPVHSQTTKTGINLQLHKNNILPSPSLQICVYCLAREWAKSVYHFYLLKINFSSDIYFPITVTNPLSH